MNDAQRMKEAVKRRRTIDLKEYAEREKLLVAKIASLPSWDERLVTLKDVLKRVRHSLRQLRAGKGANSIT